MNKDTSSPSPKSSPALKNKKVFIGLIVFGLFLFFLMWFNFLTNTLFARWDEPVNQYFMNLRRTAPNIVNITGTIFMRIGSQGLTLITIIILTILALRRQFRRFWLLFASVVGGEFLWLAAIYLINRPRPVEVRAISGLSLPGFPSGHVMIFITFCGALLYIYFLQVRNHSWRVIIAVSVIAFSLVTSVNRLYFGAHYLTDVIAGYGLGLAWTAVAIPAVEWVHLKRKAKQGSFLTTSKEVPSEL